MEESSIPAGGVSVQQSLHEIASLLVLVHDVYLKEARGREVSLALLRFIHDVGLEDVVSILDTERLKRQIMAKNTSDLMGYEIFYDWLRLLSKFLYAKTEKDPRKALHLLLTQYIIPCAASKFDTTPEPSEDYSIVAQSFRKITDKAWKILSEYSGFVQLWFLHIINANTRSYSARRRYSAKKDNAVNGHETPWTKITHHPTKGITNSATLLQSLLACGIVPKILSESEIESMMMIGIVQDSHVTFYDFLYLLELLSDRIDIDSLFLVDMDNASEYRLFALLQAVFNSTLEKTYEQRLHRVLSVAPDSIKEMDYHHYTMLMWWLCDAEYYYYTGFDLGLLQHKLRYVVKQIEEKVHNKQIIPTVFIKLYEELNQRPIEQPAISSVLFTSENNSEPEEKQNALDICTLAYSIPQCFFYSHITLFNKEDIDYSACLYYFYCEETCLRFSSSYNTLSSVFIGMSSGRLHSPQNMSLSAIYPNYMDFLCHRKVVYLPEESFSMYCEEHSVMSLYSFMMLFYFIAYRLALQYKLNKQYTDSKRLCNLVYTIFMDLIQSQEPEIIATQILLQSNEKVVEKKSIEKKNVEMKAVAVERNSNAIANIMKSNKSPSVYTAIPNMSSTPSSQIPNEVLIIYNDNKSDDFDKNASDEVQSIGNISSTSSEKATVLKLKQSIPAARDDSVVEVKESKTYLDVIQEAKDIMSKIQKQPKSYTIEPPEPAQSIQNNDLSKPQPKPQAAKPIKSDTNWNQSNSSKSYTIYEVVVLLMHYPLMSFDFNPWTILRLFKTFDEKDQKDKELSSLLQSFSVKFSVNVSELSVYFAHLYEDHELIQQCTETVSILLTENVMRLLILNEDLLQYEYSSCFHDKQNSPSNPFLKHTVTPLLSRHHLQNDMESKTYLMTPQSHYTLPLLSYKKTTQYASKHFPSLQERQIYSIFYLCSQLSHNYNGHLTYETFILFVLRCCGHGNKAEENVLDTLRTYLNNASKNLTAIQKTLQFHLLAPLYSRYELNSFNTSNILERAIQFYQRSFTSKVSKKSFQPPRPPIQYIDVARLIQFFKYFNVFHTIGTDVVDIWSVFGIYLKSIELMDKNERSLVPLPVPFTSSILTELIELLVKRFALELKHIYLACLVPMIACNAGPILEGEVLEDVLRYGGHALINSLLSSSSYLQHLYLSLLNQSNGFVFIPNIVSEVPIHLVSSCLSCSILTKHSIGSILAHSFHPRFRPHCYLADSLKPLNTNYFVHAMPPEDTPEVPTVSWVEFVEGVVRCAYKLWTDCKAADISHENNSKKSLGFDNEVNVTDTHIYYMKIVMKHIDGIKKGDRVWGVDFLTPYILLLQQFYPIDSVRDDETEEDRNWGDLLSPTYKPSAAMQSNRNRGERGQTYPNLPNYNPNYNNNSEKKMTADSSPRLSVLPSPRHSYPPSNSTSPNHSTPPIPPPNKFKAPPAKIFLFDGPHATVHSPPLSASSSHTPSQSYVSSQLFIEAKESLWPIFATYCSCGDSVDPGKLSGPNLFTLLSKLDVLSQSTILTNIGILFHQIAIRSYEITPITTVQALVAMQPDYMHMIETPSLTFEDFLIFLYLFSLIKYEGNLRHVGNIKWPKGNATTNVPLSTRHANNLPSTRNRPRTNVNDWFLFWQEQMSQSTSFRKLLTESIMPIVKKQTLLAFPEDARLRDKYACIFSIEVLLAIEKCQTFLQDCFIEQICPKNNILTNIKEVLKKARLIPKVLSEEEVHSIVKDILPEHRFQSLADSAGSLSYPQWEWMLCMIAFQAVEAAVKEKQQGEEENEQVMPGRVAEVILTISRALR